MSSGRPCRREGRPPAARPSSPRGWRARTPRRRGGGRGRSVRESWSLVGLLQSVGVFAGIGRGIRILESWTALGQRLKWKASFQLLMQLKMTKKKKKKQEVLKQEELKQPMIVMLMLL